MVLNKMGTFPEEVKMSDRDTFQGSIFPTGILIGYVLLISELPFTENSPY